MTSTVATVKRWGSSAAIILPAALVKAEGLNIGDEVVVDVHAADDFSDLIGAWRDTPIDSQAVKDESRAEEAAAERRRWGKRT